MPLSFIRQTTYGESNGEQTKLPFGMERDRRSKKQLTPDPRREVRKMLDQGVGNYARDPEDIEILPDHAQTAPPYPSYLEEPEQDPSPELVGFTASGHGGLFPIRKEDLPMGEKEKEDPPMGEKERREAFSVGAFGERVETKEADWDQSITDIEARLDELEVQSELNREKWGLVYNKLMELILTFE
tara:strand:- start:570 stop:1127 length:558 start_codon:yes stop_codon:yes gene_type:complete